MTTMVMPAEEQGWEVWENGKQGMEKTREVEGSLEDAGLLSGVFLALPVHAMASMPLIVQSTDKELYKGATQLLLEKAGLIAEEDHDSWDAVLVETNDGGSLVTGHAYLEDIFPEGALLKDADIDYSPRCYEVDSADKIVCWREQGRWALVCYKEGKPFYSEPMGKSLDAGLLSSVKQLRAQMMLADIEFSPVEFLVLSEIGAVKEKELEADLGLPVRYQARSIPQIPKTTLEVRTSGMIEWERKRKAGSKSKLWLGGIALIYLAAGAYIFMQFSKVNASIDQQNRIIANTEGASMENIDHTLKWDELDGLVKEQWPLKVYKDCAVLIPPNSAMRFTMVEIFEDDHIALKGYAPSLNSINAYIQKLKMDSRFAELTWITPPPVENTKTKMWEFDFEAERGQF